MYVRTRLYIYILYIYVCLYISSFLNLSIRSVRLLHRYTFTYYLRPPPSPLRRVLSDRDSHRESSAFSRVFYPYQHSCHTHSRSFHSRSREGPPTLLAGGSDCVNLMSLLSSPKSLANHKELVDCKEDWRSLYLFFFLTRCDPKNSISDFMPFHKKKKIYIYQEKKRKIERYISSNEL